MMGVMRSFAVAAALAAAALVLQAQPAAAEAPSKDQVRQLLSGYESVPTADRWRALGSETLAVLVTLYNDTSQPPYVRLRAVGAAAHYPVPAARTFLLAVAKAPHQKDLFVREAVLALGRAFGAKSVDDITPFLERRETVVREAAARSLARIDAPAARAALRAHLPGERQRQVRQVIERALRR